MKSLDDVLNIYYKDFPEAKDIKFWSGCNYQINQGVNELEPVGTAQSIHDCEGCDKLQYCNVKQNKPIWEWNKEIEDELNEKWRSQL